MRFVLLVDVVVALVNVAPGGSPVQGQGEARVSVHGPGHKVLLVNIWVLDGFIQQQLAFLHGPVLHHVQVVDVEVAGQVARHPDVVNPEEPDEMYPALSLLAPISYNRTCPCMEANYPLCHKEP